MSYANSQLGYEKNVLNLSEIKETRMVTGEDSKESRPSEYDVSPKFEREAMPKKIMLS